ncbi:MAG TPA: SDR family NAD(P)-dependent oxidoreductase [Polyangia bacterium]|nr:SDR family NAD(P)-dependent oxidoreductase [Polyangia bacterium]
MNSHDDLEGRQVVVTGAAGGLGPALVDTLLAAGATCHLPLLGHSDEARQNARQDARIVSVAGVDLTDEAAVRAFYASRPPLWGSVHLAGGFRAAPILDTTLADLHKQLEQNLTTAFLCCREAARNMRAAGRGGRIANVSSRAAVVPAGGAIAYTVAKAGVSALTQALADELRGDRIFVNAVVPSIIDTPANRAAMPAADHARWPKPAQISAAIAWLLSPANALTSGALVPVYGAA